MNAINIRSQFEHYVRANDCDLARLQTEARTGKRGLWSQENPVPPWEWRKPKVVDTGQVIGNVRSHLYHAPNCRSAAKIKEPLKFASKAEAEAAGYKKAGDCH